MTKENRENGCDVFFCQKRGKPSLNWACCLLAHCYYSQPVRFTNTRLNSYCTHGGTESGSACATLVLNERYSCMACFHAAALLYKKTLKKKTSLRLLCLFLVRLLEYVFSIPLSMCGPKLFCACPTASLLPCWLNSHKERAQF